MKLRRMGKIAVDCDSNPHIPDSIRYLGRDISTILNSDEMLEDFYLLEPTDGTTSGTLTQIKGENVIKVPGDFYVQVGDPHSLVYDIEVAKMSYIPMEYICQDLIDVLVEDCFMQRGTAESLSEMLDRVMAMDRDLYLLYLREVVYDFFNPEKLLKYINEGRR